jgi:hypothetical protein
LLTARVLNGRAARAVANYQQSRRKPLVKQAAYSDYKVAHPLLRPQMSADTHYVVFGMPSEPLTNASVIVREEWGQINTVIDNGKGNPGSKLAFLPNLPLQIAHVDHAGAVAKSTSIHLELRSGSNVAANMSR